MCLIVSDFKAAVVYQHYRFHQIRIAGRLPVNPLSPKSQDQQLYSIEY
ncbi:unnamed protein product [Blumeria hordei]|uniref:Uncharacterized protein n=1 Tax=Blumeria hordei TaxID=2867405 RepID=A0A383V1H8_BLUHO|nr:unnamed protein product [Blumeria hordei]